MSEKWKVKDEIASLERQVEREWDRGDFFRDKLEETLIRVARLEEALRAQCHRCVAGIPFVSEGIHACDEPTRTGEPCYGHECYLTEDLRALLSSSETAGAKE